MPDDALPDDPNVLLITCHDLGQHLGSYGVGTVRTPVLDEFAQEGVRFENAFCPAPQCSPSRAALATGRYPHQNGVLGLTHSNFAWELNEDERHLAGILGDAGWHTGVVGVHHETRRPEAFFEETIAVQGGECEAVSRDATDFIERNAGGEADEGGADAPFFLQVGYFEPHRRPGTDTGFGAVPEDRAAVATGETEDTDDAPGVTVPPYLRDEERARADFSGFEGAIERLDSAVGDLLDALDQRGLREETLVCFTTDHGIPFPRAKCSPYDPGIETALAIQWPNQIEGGEVREEPILNVDYLPTLLDLADVPTPETVRGRSFARLLTGEGEYREREAIFGELTYHDYHDPRRWVRADTENGTYKLILNFSNAPFFMDPSQAWRPRTESAFEDHAMTYHETLELYDLDEDSNETRNLADEAVYASIREELLGELREWMDETDDPLLDGIPASPIYHEALDALDGERTHEN